MGKRCLDCDVTNGHCNDAIYNKYTQDTIRIPDTVIDYGNLWYKFFFYCEKKKKEEKSFKNNIHFCTNHVIKALNSVATEADLKAFHNFHFLFYFLLLLK